MSENYNFLNDVTQTNVDVSKRNDDFSFVDTLGGLIVNQDFKDGYDKFSTATSDSRRYQDDTFVYSALSAIGNQIGDVLYENVLNYIDNVSDIDTCKVKAMRSMAAEVGADYRILNYIDNYPAEIVQLIDLFSMNENYIRLLANTTLSSLVSGLINVSCEVESLSTDEDGNEVSVTLSGVSSDFNALDDVMFSVFLNTISANLSTHYVSEAEVYRYDKAISVYNPVIWNLSNVLLGRSEDDYDPHELSIFGAINQYNLQSTFDPSHEVDLIEQGKTALSDYTMNERSVLSIEIEYRKDFAHQRFPKHSNTTTSRTSFQYPTSRYAYYKEKQVKTFYDFVQDNYKMIKTLNGSSYIIDPDYIELNDGDLSSEPLLDVSTMSLREDMISSCAANMVDIVKTIRGIRSDIKRVPEKYYMRGTFLILEYMINEYLRSSSDFILSDLPNVNIDVNEYYDSTEYFNISSSNSQNSKYKFEVNPRYFEKLVPTSLTLSQIEDFYSNTKDLKTIKTLSSYNSIVDFLTTVFDSAAGTEYIDPKDARHLVVENSDSMDDATKEKNLEIFLKYNGTPIGYQPYLNYKNTAHSSYQIHPNLFNFTNQSRLVETIKHSFYAIPEEDYSLIIMSKFNEYYKNGGIQQLWNKEIPDFSGYQSQYEYNTNTNSRCLTKNKIIGFDGIIHPDFTAITSISEVTNQLTALSGDYYDEFFKHLNFTEAEAAHYASMVNSDFSAVSSIYSNDRNQYSIRKYGYDIYGNAYILLNKSPSLLVKLKDHPMAFRASTLIDKAASIVVTDFPDEFSTNYVLNTSLKSQLTREIIDFDFNIDGNILKIDSKSKSGDEVHSNFATVQMIIPTDGSDFKRYVLAARKDTVVPITCGLDDYIGTYKMNDYIGTVHTDGSTLTLDRYGFTQKYDCLSTNVTLDLREFSYAYCDNVMSFAKLDETSNKITVSNSIDVPDKVKPSIQTIDFRVDGTRISRGDTSKFAENIDYGFIKLSAGCVNDISKNDLLESLGSWNFVLPTKDESVEKNFIKIGRSYEGDKISTRHQFDPAQEVAKISEEQFRKFLILNNEFALDMSSQTFNIDKMYVIKTSETELSVAVNKNDYVYVNYSLDDSIVLPPNAGDKLKVYHDATKTTYSEYYIRNLGKDKNEQNLIRISKCGK